MSRHRTFTLLALSAGLLTLPACSSGGPASVTTVRVGSVVHIGRYTQVFASPLPTSSAQISVVESFREGQVLWDKSEETWRLVRPVRDYVTGQALAHLTIAVKAGRARGDVLAGADRFFMTQVTAMTAHSATVTTCDDGSKFTEEKRRTGEVDPSFLPSPAQEYLFETWRLVRLSGHWAIAAISFASLPSRSAEHCQPGITGSGPSARPDVAVLFRQMSTAVRAASSVHLSGTVRQGGKLLGLNLGITGSGGLWGQVSENGGVVTVLATHGHSYLKITAAYLRAAHLPATACGLYCGKYLEYSAAQSHALLTGLNLTTMTRSITETPAGQFKLLGAVTVDGQLAWLLQDSHGNSTYVAAHGKPYILREVAAAAGESSVDLTQWNAAWIPGPPPASQIVNLSQLES